MNNLNQYFFTFGQVHRHPDTDEPMKDYFIEIHAPHSDAAIDWMANRYGYKWSGMYSPKSFDKSFYPAGRYGDVVIIHELKTA